jgi:hydrogenase-4 component E
MNLWVEALLLAVVLANLALLGSGRLAFCIRLAAAQGALIGTMPLLAAREAVGAEAIVLAAVAVALKGGVFPVLLGRAMRTAEVSREDAPFVGPTASVLLGLAALGASLMLGARLAPPGPEGRSLLLPAGFFTAAVGLFLIVSRRTALSQVLGYLVMENGIYLVGVVLAGEEPLWIGLGVLLDVFVAVFLMGIMIFHINREFDHIDAGRLTELRDWTRRWRRLS